MTEEQKQAAQILLETFFLIHDLAHDSPKAMRRVEKIDELLASSLTDAEVAAFMADATPRTFEAFPKVLRRTADILVRHVNATVKTRRGGVAPAES